MSLSPSSRLGLIIALNDAGLARDPKRRRAIAVEMSKKLQAMKLGIEDNCIVDPRTVRERDSEQAARQASKADKLIKGGMDEWVAHNAASEEAAEWRRAEDDKQAIEHSPKAQLLRKLRSLDAMLSVLPPELRAEVGGFVQLAQFPTDEARLKEIGRHTEKMSTVVERFLDDENRDSIEPSLEQAPMPDGSPLPDTLPLRISDSVLSSSSVIAVGMAAWCVSLALLEFNPPFRFSSVRWPFQLSQWAICAGSALLGLRFGRNTWRGIVILIVAVLFNPIAPIRFDQAWSAVEWIAAAALISTTEVARRCAGGIIGKS